MVSVFTLTQIGEAGIKSTIRGLPSATKSSAIGHPPDGVVAVFAEKEAAVFGNRDSDRATPHIPVGSDKSSHKIFVFTECFPGRMVEGYANNLVAGAFLSVPRTVERGENVAFVFSRN
jgi:hypothetical protein